MATLLNAATSNSNPASATGTAAGAKEVLIELTGDSVMGGADVTLQVSTVNTAAKFVSVDKVAVLTGAKALVLTVGTGTFVRALLNRASASTSVTVLMTDLA